MTDRGERREEIKLMLEYAKLAVSALGVTGLVFVALQWMHTNSVATQTVYQRIATEWWDHLAILVDKPELRPYFEERKSIATNDQNRGAVLALADVRLDVMDAILTYADLHSREEAQKMHGWHNTFADAFRSSPPLCARIQETRSRYGLIVPIAERSCPLIGGAR